VNQITKEGLSLRGLEPVFKSGGNEEAAIGLKGKPARCSGGEKKKDQHYLTRGQRLGQKREGTKKGILKPQREKIRGVD